MKIKIQVDDKNLERAKDMSADILYELLARYPYAEADFSRGIIRL